MSNPHGDAASHETDSSDDHWDEEDENVEDLGEYKPPVTDIGQGFSRNDMCFHQRTHKPCLKSYEQRLLAYKERKDGVEGHN
jgi:hypothetical protein